MSHIYQSELMAMKDWRVRKILRDLRLGFEHIKRGGGGGLARLMRQHYEVEIPRFERELERRKRLKAGCDCLNPEPKNGGVAHVSEDCPIHAGEFHCVTTVL